MQRTNPIVKDGQLYRAETESDSIGVGSPTWFDWLDQHNAFSFVGAALTYTARKTLLRTGGSSWKAYCTRQGKL